MLSLQKLKWIREQLHIRDMLRSRDNQLEDLRNYEKEINTIDPHAHVSVINDADLEGPPRQMQVREHLSSDFPKLHIVFSILMPTKPLREFLFLMTPS